jgi:hypothetical protein
MVGTKLLEAHRFCGKERGTTDPHFSTEADVV